MAHKAFKFKLHPSDDQSVQLFKWAGQCRFVYNRMLEDNIAHYKNTKKFIFGKEYHKKLPSLKSEFEWLKDVPAQALQQSCLDMEKALRLYFKNKKAVGFPKFKSKKNSISFRIPQSSTKQIKLFKNFIQLPKDIGKIKMTNYRKLEGRILNVTVKYENYSWYVILCMEIENKIQQPLTNSIGIDFGFIDFITLSNGTKETTISWSKEQEQIKLIQKKLSKQKVGSNNYNKTKKKLKNLHTKLVNKRKDLQHKLSRKITNDYSAVFVEDLDLKKMSKNFGKQVHNQSYYQFVEMLKYKSNIFGKVDRYFPSSQICNICNGKKKLTLSERTYSCDSCDSELDRDINAAINIEKEGIRLYKEIAGGLPVNACEDNNSKIAYDISELFNVAISRNNSSVGKKPIVL